MLSRIRYTVPGIFFNNYITGYMDKSDLLLPGGWEKWKAIYGQRQIKPTQPKK